MNAEEHALTVAAAFPWSPQRAWLSVQACRFSDITVAALSIPPKNVTNRLAKRRPNPAMLSGASKTPRRRAKARVLEGRHPVAARLYRYFRDFPRQIAYKHGTTICVPEVIMTTPDTPALSSSASLDIPAIPPPSSAGASYEEQNVAAPVRLDERIQALDTIRGFALLGILLRPGGT